MTTILCTKINTADGQSKLLMQRRSFTQLMAKIQQSGQIWKPILPSQQDQSNYADALAQAGCDLFHSLTTIQPRTEITWFNDRLQYHWQQITQSTLS